MRVLGRYKIRMISNAGRGFAQAIISETKRYSCGRIGQISVSAMRKLERREGEFLPKDSRLGGMGDGIGSRDARS